MSSLDISVDIARAGYPATCTKPKNAKNKANSRFSSAGDNLPVTCGARIALTAAAIAAMADRELSHGSLRSAEYRQGMIDLLQRRFNGEPFPNRYRTGTAQFDAHQAGVDRGWLIYHAHNEAPSEGSR